MVILLLGVIIIIIGGLYINNKLGEDSKEIIPIEKLKTNFYDGQVCFNEQTSRDCYDIALRKTEKERQEGLMNSEGMNDNQGMLFVFDKEDYYGMWMKNMLIPLDMIWINSDGVVVFLVHDQEPCKDNYCPTIESDVQARYVLEINAGQISKKGIRAGDIVKIRINNYGN